MWESAPNNMLQEVKELVGVVDVGRGKVRVTIERVFC
jgi:hypothetical protein